MYKMRGNLVSLDKRKREIILIIVAFSILILLFISCFPLKNIENEAETLKKEMIIENLEVNHDNKED